MCELFFFFTFCRKRYWDNFKDILESRVKESESHSIVSDSLWPKDYRVHGILQARILEWVPIPFYRGSSQPREWTQVSCIAGGFFTSWAKRRPKLGLHPYSVCVFFLPKNNVYIKNNFSWNTFLVSTELLSIPLHQRMKSDPNTCFCLCSNVVMLVAQSCPTLCDPMDCSPIRLLCPWDFP